MIPYWNKLSERVDKMTLRERAMVLAGVLVLTYVLIDALSLTPMAAKRKIALEQLNQRRNEIVVLDAQLKGRASTADPDAPNRTRLKELRSKIAAFESEAKEQSAQLISAQRMRSVLQQMLASRPGLELVELKTLPQSTVTLGDTQKPAGKPGDTSAKPPETAKAETGTIYKHGVELTVRGRYLDLLSYLKQIEALPVRLYWDKLEMTVVDHPVVSMRMTIYTISLDKAWIQV